MIKLGMIGLNEGNGHPFSYAAIFNGYDPKELVNRCPFSLIKEYLPREHRNEVFIDDAKVTHIWTQNHKLSEDVARVSLIPNIVSEYEEMIGKIDGVILARDDPWNHLHMALPFIKANIPIFIDKQLVSTKMELDILLDVIGDNSLLMAGSSTRFTRDLSRANKKLQNIKINSIHGMSRVSWMRYGHHLIEGIICLFGIEINWVRSLNNKIGHDIIQIEFSSGMNVILEFIENIHLPIQFTCFSEDSSPYIVPFTDYFFSFRKMLLHFVELIKTKKYLIPVEEIVDIAKVILAGDISKKKSGQKICPKTFCVKN